jgi:hypothetical protein
MADKDDVRISDLVDGIPRLNGNNYADWRFAMQNSFVGANMWELVSGEVQDYNRRNKGETKLKKALSAITKTIEPSQYSYIRNAKDGTEAWKALEDIYLVDSHVTRHSLQRELMNYRHDSSKPIQTYINDILSIINRMRAIGMPTGDRNVMDALILHLNDGWDSISGQLSTSMRDDTKLSDITSALINEDRRRKSREEDPHEVAMKATHYHSRNSQNRGVRERICYNCRKTGHIIRNCPDRTHENDRNEEKSDRANIATYYGLAY